MGVLYNRYMVRQESPITERLLNLYFIYLAMSLTVYGVELFDVSQKLHYFNFSFYQALRNFISQRKKMAGGQQWKMSWKGYLYVNEVSHKLVKKSRKQEFLWCIKINTVDLHIRLIINYFCGQIKRSHLIGYTHMGRLSKGNTF